MTPSEVKATRERLGLSAEALARAIHVSSGRVVRHWEAGTRAVEDDTHMLLLRYFERYGLPEEALGEAPKGKTDIGPAMLLLLRYFAVYGLPHEAGVRF